jgi:hypothetical protein
MSAAVKLVAAKLREALDVCVEDGSGAIDPNGLAEVACAALAGRVSGWRTVRAERALLVQRGNDTILVGNLPEPIELLLLNPQEIFAGSDDGAPA